MSLNDDRPWALRQRVLVFKTTPTGYLLVPWILGITLKDLKTKTYRYPTESGLTSNFMCRLFMYGLVLSDFPIIGCGPVSTGTHVTYSWAFCNTAPTGWVFKFCRTFGKKEVLNFCVTFGSISRVLKLHVPSDVFFFHSQPFQGNRKFKTVEMKSNIKMYRGIWLSTG